MASWKDKVSSMEEELGSEEERLNREFEVYETKNFEKDEEVLYTGSDDAILRRFKV